MSRITASIRSLPAIGSRSALLSAALLSSAALSVAALSGACKGDAKTEGEASASKGSDSKGSSKGDKAKTPAKPSERPKYAPYRALLAESARAELEVGGLLIDFGTADQHKYTRGGWQAGWGASKNENGISYALADSRKSDINVVIPTGEEVKEVVIRGRTAVDGQVLTVYVDGNRVGDGTFTSEWSTIRIPAKGLEAGLHGIDFVYSKSGPVRADIDWALLALEAGQPEPAVVPRVIPLKLGASPKRALIAPTSRSYSFFVQPPSDAKLLFDFGSDKGGNFKVMAQADGEAAEELWSGTGTADWQEAVVDLGAYGGKATRLSLVSEGGPGIAGWGEPEIMLAKAPEPPMSEGKKPTNVIVILMDTMRADNFAAFDANHKVKTPAFDKFAADSLVFYNAYTQENWTKPAVATVLSGTYPNTHQTKTDTAALPKEVELISERLKSEGFQTAGYVANGYVSEKFGFEKGWDTFKNYIRESLPSQAEKVFGDSLTWLKANKDKGKYFLYIQTIDPHVPYRHNGETTDQYYPGGYSGALGKSIPAETQIAMGKKTNSDADLKWLKAMHYGEVSHHDEEMGKFFAELEAMGVMEDTMIIITNDHGEELGDHGKFGHGHTLYEELLRAPLTIHFKPTIKPSVLTNEVAENVDIAPTIVDALGLKPMAKADGLSLVPLMKGEPVQRPYYAMSEFMESRRAIRVGSWKMIWAGGTTVNVYDSEKDRGEKVDLAKTSLIARRMLEVHAGEAQATFDKKQRLSDISTKRQFKAGEADIDPETRKQLEALGYFGE